MISSDTRSPKQILQEVFGYPSFRMDQEAIIDRTLNNQDSLIIMPTGGGKSLTYQIPAIIQPGLTLVISPLIALMNDQVQSLTELGVAAAAPNSASESGETQRVRQEIENGLLKLLYLSPERAVSDRFLDFISGRQVALIAIDEAHCVSIWGNDFRPVYGQLTKLLRLFPEVPVMALTATADRATREDISNQLELENAQTFISSFERKNIYLEVRPSLDRVRQIHQFLKLRPGQSGIIYCLSRKGTESLSAKLKGMGYSCAYYHARMEKEQRHEVQRKFINDETQIICATIAFGMGIDKSNIRWVIHYNLPKNVESYYQEIGRAGRDGEPAHTLLFGGYGDIMTYRQMFEAGQADPNFQKVQLAKLNRMWEFVQATNCRTNFILNYFGEHRIEPCQHCDNCRKPPVQSDGTVIAQKALSAQLRLKEQVGIGTLVDVLRGSRRADIMRAGYHRIKTFGAGASISRFQWMQYITQLIDRGLLEIDYTKNSRLMVTPLGREVIKGQQQVKLTVPREWSEQKSINRKKVSRTSLFREELSEALSKTRGVLADKHGISPFHIFNDESLAAMTETNPLFKHDFQKISGVTAIKWDRYGADFVQAIRAYCLNQHHRRQVPGLSLVQTLQLRDKGLPVKEIAQLRELQISTIYSHLADLYRKDEDIALSDLITADEVRAIRDAWIKSGRKMDINSVAEFLLKPMALGKIKVCLAVFEKEGRQ